MSDQSIQPGQKLTEMWGISFEKHRLDSPIVARLDSWPHHTYYTGRGEGKTVEEARLALITMLARAIHEDPNPFGDLGKVIHTAHVIEFLRSLTDEREANNLADNFDDLPEGWETVVDHIITLFQGHMDFWPEEETLSSEDAKRLAPPLEPPADE
jgi:hypothetical protein